MLVLIYSRFSRCSIHWRLRSIHEGKSFEQEGMNRTKFVGGTGTANVSDTTPATLAVALPCLSVSDELRNHLERHIA
jgi:hypothetical protein